MTTPLITQPPTVADIVAAVRATLADGPDAYRLPDYLASVDWSERCRPTGEAADMLGRLEMWDSEYREGDIEWAEFEARLDGLRASAVAR